jgi:methionyl-tRNA formyltransferase
MRTATSAVKQLALARGLEVFQPESLRDQEARAPIAAARPDVLVVAAYGLILPLALLEIPRYGALNIHASLLPRWRGAAPVQRALLAGDAETGITIMRMDAGLDTGPILLQRGIAIAPDDDARSLHDKLAALGAQMIVDAIVQAAAGGGRPVPQPEAGVSYAHKIVKRDAEIDWTADATQIERMVRAMRPAPGAAARLKGEVLKLWRTRVLDARAEPGRVIAVGPEGVLVACGQGGLLVTELQRAGGKRLMAGEFLRGVPIAPGERLE